VNLSVFCFVEPEAVKEKAKPAPKLKGLVYCVNNQDNNMHTCYITLQ